MAARALIISNCLYGADIDPLSVELAGLSLQLLAPAASTDHILDFDDGDYEWHVASKAAPGPVAQHARLLRPPGPPTSRLPGLRAGDALTGRPWPPRMPPGQLPGLHWPVAFPRVCGDRPGGFDAVIGNPPFLGGNQITGAYGPAYREHLISALAGGRRTTVDLAVYCWIRAHQLASPNGVVAIIGPDSLLRAGGNAKLGLGELERRGWRPYRRVGDLAWTARTAAVRVSMTWSSRWGGADIPAEVRNMPEGEPPAGLWTSQPGRTVEINGTQVDLTCHTPTSDLATGYWWDAPPGRPHATTHQTAD